MISFLKLEYFPSIKTHTFQLFIFLMLVACYLVHSESEIIIAKTNELTAFVVDKYTTLYYSLLPEIETTTESVDDTPPPSDEL